MKVYDNPECPPITAFYLNKEMPPKVDHGLTELGEKMLPIIDAMANFGTYYKFRV